MAGLFEPLTINGMTIPNRFVRSATWEGLAGPDGSPTPALIAMMAELARNQVGLIITGYAFVRSDGQASSGQLGAHRDDLISPLRELTAAVHTVGGKIALQIVHGGLLARAQLSGKEKIGPSAISQRDGAPCREMNPDDIRDIKECFTAAAVRAREAGFDAVQLHGAHGYLLSQFLSPAFNHRTDEYGGSLENRARFLLEIVHDIRAAVGPGFPLLIKLNSEDFLESGMTREEALRVAHLLQEASIDAIELSGGTAVSPRTLRPPRPGKQNTAGNEAYYLEAAKLAKRQLHIPIMLVGGIRSYETAAEILSSGSADCVALCRPLICEPDLIRRWQQGDMRPSECGSCNGCFEPAASGHGLYCVPKAKRKNAS